MRKMAGMERMEFAELADGQIGLVPQRARVEVVMLPLLPWQLAVQSAKRLQLIERGLHGSVLTVYPGMDFAGAHAAGLVYRGVRPL
jgi:hypothetical protein